MVGQNTSAARNFTIFAGAGAFALMAFAAPGDAAAYPDQPITLVAPYGAGGSSDLAARTLAKHAEEYVPEPIAVVNRTGAGGVVGSTSVLEAEPDGHTLLLARIGSQAVAPARNPGLPYTWDSFTFLGLLELNPLTCLVHADSPYETIEDLATKLREEPGALTFSSAGPGTVDFMTGYRLLLAVGAGKDAAVHIPAGSGGEAVTSVLGQHTDFTCQNLAPAWSNIEAGTLRPLVVTTPEGVPSLPDVPTAREAGYPELEGMVGWSALYGPPGLPEEVVDYWADTLQKIGADEGWLQDTRELSSMPRVLPPDETREFVERQFDVYRELATELDLMIE